MFGDIFNMPYKDLEKQKEAMRAIMREYRAREKVLHTLQGDWEKAIEEEFVKKESWKTRPAVMEESYEEFVKKESWKTEDNYEESFVEVAENMCIRTLNDVTHSRLYRTSQTVREMHNLDDVKKIYQDLWKTLETVRAKQKEDLRKTLEKYKADFKEF